MAKKPQRKVTLKRVTAAYAYIDKPDTGHTFSNNKFKVTAVHEDEAVFADLMAASKSLAEEAFPEVDEDDIRMPLRTPEEQTKEAFEGKYTVNTSTKFQPSVYDAMKKLMSKKTKIMGGDLVSLILILLPYESTEKVREGKKTVTVTVYGISAQLAAVQLIEKRSGGVDASMFDEYEDGFDSSGMAEDDQDVVSDDDDDEEGGDY